MKKSLLLFFLISCSYFSFSDQFNIQADEKTVSDHLDAMNLSTSISFQNNEIVISRINTYLSRHKALISKMLSLSKYYFPIFES